MLLFSVHKTNAMETLSQFSISSPDVHTMELARLLTCLGFVIGACVLTFLFVRWKESGSKIPAFITIRCQNLKSKLEATRIIPLPGQSALTA